MQLKNPRNPGVCDYSECSATDLQACSAIDDITDTEVPVSLCPKHRPASIVWNHEDNIPEDVTIDQLYLARIRFHPKPDFLDWLASCEPALSVGYDVLSNDASNSRIVVENKAQAYLRTEPGKDFRVIRDAASWPPHERPPAHLTGSPSMPLAPAGARPDASERATAEETLALVADLPCQSAGDEAFIAEILGGIKATAKEIKAKKEAATKPMNEALKTVRGWFKPLEDAYSKAETTLKEKVINRREQMRFDANAAREALVNADTSEKAEAAKLALAASTPEDTPGLQVRELHRFEVTDLAAIPREYLAPDEKAIKEALKAGEEIPGVAPRIQYSIAVVAK